MSSEQGVPVGLLGFFVPNLVVPKVRVELTRGCPHRFLRPARLPFRHFGTEVYSIAKSGRLVALSGRRRAVLGTNLS